MSKSMKMTSKKYSKKQRAVKCEHIYADCETCGLWHCITCEECLEI